VTDDFVRLHGGGQNQDEINVAIDGRPTSFRVMPDSCFHLPKSAADHVLETGGISGFRIVDDSYIAPGPAPPESLIRSLIMMMRPSALKRALIEAITRLSLKAVSA
jgi:hypothetical protein